MALSLMPPMVLGMSRRPATDARFSPQSTGEAKPIDAVKGILNAFDKYPIVGLGESHWLQEEADFVIRLIRDPAFSAKVNDIVVECGNALYQDVMDRYLSGKEV